MVVVIDPQIAGISGDMMLCALIDMGANKQKILDGLRESEQFLTGSTITKIDFSTTKKHGISATQLILNMDENTHERKGTEIKTAILQSTKEIGLSVAAQQFAESCIDSLISAESKIHGESTDSVHFHEASSIDTLIDIVGTAIALDDLELFDEEIVSLPVSVGGGTISFSHGTTSNPASAILEIFKNSGIPIIGGMVDEELATPTGASLLVNLVNSNTEFYPTMEINSIGYGAGTKDFEQFSNVLKIVRGKSTNALQKDTVKILETNVDDVSGEILGNLIETLMNKGAKDVSIYHGITKKNRPTNLISIICDQNSIKQLMNILITETGTLGVRVMNSDRLTVPRSSHKVSVILEGKNFDVSYKKSTFEGNSSFKIEFDDLKIISNTLNKSIKETESIIRKEISKFTDNE